MPTHDPTTPASASPASGGAPAGGSVSGGPLSGGAGAAGGTSSLAPSVMTSLAVHGALVATLVFAFRVASPPMDRRGLSVASASLETPQPSLPEEAHERLSEVLPIDPPVERLPEVMEFERLTPDPLADVFVESPSALPKPEPVLNPFVDPLAVLDGVRIRPIQRTVVPPETPAHVAPTPAPVEVEPLPPRDAAPVDTPSGSDEAQAADDASPVPIADSCTPPVYPPVAERRGWKGTVVLLIDVAADGAVIDVRVETSSGFGVLDDAAVDAVERWRFTPARAGGEARATTVRKPIQFGR